MRILLFGRLRWDMCVHVCVGGGGGRVPWESGTVAGANRRSVEAKFLLYLL